MRRITAAWDMTCGGRICVAPSKLGHPEDLPVRKGQQVEVTVRIDEPVEPTWPLRGLPVRLTDPFLPANPESEWEADR